MLIVNASYIRPVCYLKAFKFVFQCCSFHCNEMSWISLTNARHTEQIVFNVFSSGSEQQQHFGLWTDVFLIKSGAGLQIELVWRDWKLQNWCWDYFVNFCLRSGKTFHLLIRFQIGVRVSLMTYGLAFEAWHLIHRGIKWSAYVQKINANNSF